MTLNKNLSDGGGEKLSWNWSINSRRRREKRDGCRNTLYIARTHVQRRASLEYERSVESDLSKEHVPTQDFPSDDRAFSSPSQAQKKLPSVFSHTSVQPPLSTAHSLISKNIKAVRWWTLLKYRCNYIKNVHHINYLKRCIDFINEVHLYYYSISYFEFNLSLSLSL